MDVLIVLVVLTIVIVGAVQPPSNYQPWAVVASHVRHSDFSLRTARWAGPTLGHMLGDELKKAREAAGLTQEQLAFKAGVHRTYVSLLERDRKSPTLDVLFRICKALGVPASRIVARVERRRR